MSFDFKHAPRAQLNAEYKRIAKEIGDDRFFTRKELNFLPEVLADDEQVLAFSSGLMDGDTWLIVLTDRRIIFLDKGMIYGLKQSSIDFDKINAISGETGILFGKIKIEDGARQREITNVWKKTVTRFCNKARDAIAARRAVPVAGAQTIDVASQLEKLAALRDKGVLTDQEFVLQKTKLLRA